MSISELTSHIVKAAQGTWAGPASPLPASAPAHRRAAPGGLGAGGGGGAAIWIM